MTQITTSQRIASVNAMLLACVVTLFTCMAAQRSFAQSAGAPDADRLTPSELEELLGSIALYPDPLLANVLAASVYPDEVAEAAKFMATRPTKEALKARPWEDPVKAVAEVPEVIKMMGDYPDWTIALGQAYLTQAKDVMDTVQSLRKKAFDNGALKTSPEMTVQQEAQVIYIEPTDPQVIYVPSYSPQVVYVDHHDDDWVAGAIGFGLGITAGLIIGNNMDCHWGGGCIGWGGGWGDVDVDIDRNFEMNGDINVGNRGDTNIDRGDRTRTGGDRTNVSGGDRNASRNRVGNEGNAWAPNKNKNLASSKPSEAGKMRNSGSNRMNTPNAGNRGGAGAGAGAPRAGQQPAGGANRGGSAGGARASQQPAGGANRSGAGGGGGARPSQPAAKSKVPQSRPPSAFSGGSSTRADSARGSSSRQSSASRNSGSRSSGGASRSSGGSRSGGASRGGGGGSRGGGGGRGGGGRR